MKKGSIIEGRIEYVDFPNKGILIADNERVVVKGTLPGQLVKAAVNKGRKGKFEARLLEVMETSELETAKPACPYFGQCGGCSYQMLPYEEQLHLKSEQVKKLLDKVIVDDYEFEAPLASPKQWEYRNKMEFTFGNEYKDGPVTLGLHKKGSFYDIIPVYECKIIHPDMRAILKATAEFAAESGFSFYHKMSKEGYFRHLLVRRAEKTGEILVDIITTTQPGPDLNKWKEKLLSLDCAGNICGILHTNNDSAADAVIDEGTEVLYGQDHFTEEILGLHFNISPFSFFQTNSLGAEVLYTAAREYVLGEQDGLDKSDSDKNNAACIKTAVDDSCITHATDIKEAADDSCITNTSGVKTADNDMSKTMSDKIVFDLYSGTGTIGQLLAPVSKKVIGIEIVEEAVEAAKVNAKANGLDNCAFLAGDVLKKIDEVEERPDFIVLDPPREGINPKALGKILAYGVDNMVYISCKPTSLAADFVAIQAAGYKVKKVKCVDMFPETVHVETVVLMSRKEK